MRLLFLYEELAWYFVNCVNTLCKDFNAEVLIVCKQPNAVAPFRFSYIHPKIKIVQRETLGESGLIDLYTEFRPDLLYLGGWSCNAYLELLKKTNHPCAVIGFDNRWNGSLKQRVGALYFRWSIKPYIKGAFIPGKSQMEFAARIGFSKDDIATGAYCGDADLFHSFYQKYKAEKIEKFPKQFLYVGRYAQEKGVVQLWEAFAELKRKHSSPWKLVCVGIGDVDPLKHPDIEHLGFVQPDDMEAIIRKSGVLVLPSRFEPWGVVVHEYAAAGLPMLLSNAVGAGEAFLKEGENGFQFNNEDTSSVFNAMKRITELSDAQLNEMGQKSNRIALLNTPEIWAQTLIGFIRDNSVNL